MKKHQPNPTRGTKQVAYTPPKYQDYERQENTKDDQRS